MAKKSGKHLEDSGKDWGRMAVSVIKGSGLAMLITVGAALVCAVLVSGGWIDLNRAMKAAPLLCVPGGVTGAVFFGCRRREWAVAAGAGIGLGLFVLLAALGCGLCGTLPAGTSVPGVLAACAGSGAAVGLLGRGSRKSKRRKHR